MPGVSVQSLLEPEAGLALTLVAGRAGLQATALFPSHRGGLLFLEASCIINRDKLNHYLAVFHRDEAPPRMVLTTRA